MNMMSLKDYLQGFELFDGLSEEELDQVLSICRERVLSKGEVLTLEGEFGDEMYVIIDGFVEVLLSGSAGAPPRAVVNLGPGQITGEMALIDQGPRSATVKALSDPTCVQVIKQEDFDKLCRQNTQIGYIVMKNMAADLVFKLRHRNLSER